MLIIPYLQGGLGNRIFIIGACIHYALIHSRQVVFPPYIQRNIHGNNDAVYKLFPHIKTLKKIPVGMKVIKETSSSDVKMLPERSDVMLKGYFQNHKFIDAVKKHVKIPTDKQIGTAFIHIRRGDFLKFPHNISCGRISLDEYYRKSLRKLKAMTSTKKLIIMSDDMEYASRAVRDFIGDTTWIIEDSKSKTDIDCLFEMISCDSCICANSTFSYWGAVLSNSKFICMPHPWTISYIPGITADLKFLYPENAMIISSWDMKGVVYDSLLVDVCLILLYFVLRFVFRKK